MGDYDCRGSPGGEGVGVLLRAPQLCPGESVLWSVLANRTQGRSSVGGKLFVTSQRVCFVAHRLDHALRRSPDVLIPHEDIADVGIAPPSSTMTFNGSMRARVRVDLGDGESEYFVVNHQSDVCDALRSTLGVGCQGGAAVAPPPSDAQLASALPWPFWVVGAVTSLWLAGGRAVEVLTGDGIARVVAGAACALLLTIAAVCVVQLVALARARRSRQQLNPGSDERDSP